MQVVEFFREVASLWKYVPRILPILATYVCNIQQYEHDILKNYNHLPI